MGFKYLVGRIINETVEAITSWNYRSVPFIPNGRILGLDLKRAGIKPMVIFDVGANTGQTANEFATHFKNATIYSFEPVASVYEEMVSKTSNPRIKCFNQALGARPEQVSIFKSNSYSGVASINGANSSDLTEEEIITVNTGVSICKDHNISMIDILKIDTEGYEINVFDGFKPMLSEQVKLIYVEVGFNPDTNRHTYITKILEYLQPYGFIVSAFYNPYRTGQHKLRLQHCDLLLVNTNLVNI